MQTIIYRMDKQQVPTGNYIQYPVMDHGRDEYEKECICARGSLCCAAEINTTL